MSETEELFIDKLKDFRNNILDKEYDDKSLVYLFANFLTDNWDEEVLNNDDILNKIHLVCEEFEIDLDKTIELFKTL